MVPVSRLPDLCLHALFRQMPLKDQMIARKVCRRWEELALEVTRNRQNLAIVLSDPYRGVDYNKWNSLNYNRLDEDTVQQIVHTYSAINKLQLKITTDKDHQLTFNSVVRLLEQWQKTLVTLHFKDECINFEEQDSSPDTAHFFTALNDLSSLQYLKLSLISMQLDDLPILGQLKEIVLKAKEPNSNRHFLKDFVAMLAKYITEDSPLVAIRFSSDCYQFQIGDISHMAEHLRDRFTQLDFQSGHDNLVPLCGHFRSLTRFEISPSDLTIHGLFGHLSQLTQLNNLKLGILFLTILPDTEEDEDLLLPQLKSVKSLHLTVVMRSHEEVNRLKIAWTMPNLESCSIECCGNRWCTYSECTTCGLDNFGVGTLRHDKEIAKGCLRAIFGSLKRPESKLPVIKHDCEEILGTAEELLAE